MNDEIRELQKLLELETDPAMRNAYQSMIDEQRASIVNQPAPVESQRERVPASNALFDQIGHGAMLNTSDEFFGVGRAANQLLRGDFDVVKNFSEGAEMYRDRLRAGREDNPNTAMVGNIVGETISPANWTGAGLIRGLGGPVRRFIGGAALEGTKAAASGFAGADDPEQSRVGNAIKQGIGGALAGGTIAAAIPATGGAPEQAARMRIAQAMDDSGLSADDIDRRMQELGPRGRLVDVDDSFRHLGEQAQLSLGDDIDQAKQVLLDRGYSSPQAIAEGANRTLAGGVDVPQWRQDNIVSKYEEASPLYEQTRDIVVDEDLFRPFMQNEAVSDAISVAEEIAKREGHTIPNTDTIGFWHMAKRGLDNEVSKLLRSGDVELAMATNRLKNRLLGVMDAEAPDYGVARKKWSDAKSLENAFDLGNKISFMQGGANASKLMREGVETFKTLTSQEQEAFKMGTVQHVWDVMDNPSSIKGTLNWAQQQRKAPVRYLKDLFGSEQTNQMLNVMDAEISFRETLESNLGNSATARRQNRALELEANDVNNQLKDQFKSVLMAFGAPTPSNISKAIEVTGARRKILEGQRTNNAVARMLVLNDNIEKVLREIETKGARPTGQIAVQGALSGFSRGVGDETLSGE